MLKRLLKKALPAKTILTIRLFRQYLRGTFVQKSYSQEGEDILLRRLFPHRNKGFFVDVGAHHPLRFSNTYFFYKLGWVGINIDAQPGSMLPFRLLRPRDINLEQAIAKDEKELTFYIFEEGALNSFDEALSRQRAKQSNVALQEKKITTKPLSEVLAQHLPKGVKIDFMSVDVEGYDLEVLESNDWKKYRPHYLLVECFGVDFDDINSDATGLYLRAQNYKPIAKTANTTFFQDVLSKDD